MENSDHVLLRMNDSLRAQRTERGGGGGQRCALRVRTGWHPSTAIIIIIIIIIIIALGPRL